MSVDSDYISHIKKNKGGGLEGMELTGVWVCVYVFGCLRRVCVGVFGSVCVCV